MQNDNNCENIFLVQFICENPFYFVCLCYVSVLSAAGMIDFSKKFSFHWLCSSIEAKIIHSDVDFVQVNFQLCESPFPFLWQFSERNEMKTIH